MTTSGGPTDTDEVPAVLMRGGTSKGVFLHGKDMPPPGPTRDRMILRLMGSPDPMQIDGLGGTFSSTSKVVVVEPGPGPGMITYWFGQVGVDTPTVDWSGNCGNLTTAVGAFAVDEKLVAAQEPLARVPLLNGNTGVVVEVELSVANGKACTQGSHQVAGVPGKGAPVTMRYLSPGGHVLGRELPTGSVRDVVLTSSGEIDVSLVDVAHPYVLASAEALGLQIGEFTPAELNSDTALLQRLEELRAACAVLVGAVGSPERAAVDSPLVPRLVLVQEPTRARMSTDAGEALAVLAVSMGKVHHAVPLTGALCSAAATMLPGTVAYDSTNVRQNPVRLRHPRGTVEVEVDTTTTPSGVTVTSVGIVSTARRLLAGMANLS